MLILYCFQWNTRNCVYQMMACGTKTIKKSLLSCHVHWGTQYLKLKRCVQGYFLLRKKCNKIKRNLSKISLTCIEGEKGGSKQSCRGRTSFLQDCYIPGQTCYKPGQPCLIPVQTCYVPGQTC